MPSNAPEKVKISPTAARTDECIIPIGGTKKDDIINMMPNMANITPKIN